MKLLALLVLSLASPAGNGALVEHPCPTVLASDGTFTTLVCDHSEFVVETAKTPSSGAPPLVWVAVPSVLAVCIAVAIRRRHG